MKENGFINEFKKFIMRGNVMDMAVRCPHCTSILEEEAVKEAAATVEK